MTKEILREARYYCDGCGYAVLESTSEHIEQAFEQCGWVHATTHHGDKVDYCPVCRRDSPFEAVQRVREAVERHERIYAPSDAEGIPVQVILRALDGTDE